MAYTPPVIKTLPLSWGHLRNDSNGHGMTGALGWFFQTQDNTASPVSSPVSVASTTQALVVPQNAVQIWVSAGTAFSISEDSSFTASFTVPAGIIFTVDVTGMANVYFKTTSTIAISFAFKMLEAG